jgi:myosin heavy subunit
MGYVSLIRNLPTEMQLPILELVENVEANLRAELSVRREDFDQLRNVVGELAEAQRRTEQRVEELAEAQRRTEQRVERLETIVTELAEAQRRTEQRVERLETIVTELAEAQRRTEQRVERLETIVTELAEAQRRTEQRVEELAEAQRRTEQRVEELAEAQRRTEQRVEELAAGLNRLDKIVTELVAQMRNVVIRLDKHTGLFLELRYSERPYAYFSRVLRRARTVSFPEIEDQAAAVLSEQETDELALLDVIVRGRPKARPEINEIWLAVEVSATVDAYDVERAKRRSELLRRLGLRVVPTVAGDGLTEGGLGLAGVEGVAVFQNGSIRYWDEALTAALAATS